VTSAPVTFGAVAQQLAERGWRPFPGFQASKTPAMRGWPGLNHSEWDDADLAAAMLYAIETDLAGAAGTPGELDNIALSNLTLTADTHKLYQMRYVDLPQGYYIATAAGLANAMYYDTAILSHLDSIDSLEKPAVIADFLLRFDLVNWALVTAVNDNKLVLSLRTSSSKLSAAQMMKRLVKKLGEGGGHRTKAGGVIPLSNATPGEIERIRAVLRRAQNRPAVNEAETVTRFGAFELDKFLEVSERAMKRREVVLSDRQRRMLGAAWARRNVFAP
jgi:hypothetical protein